MLSQINSHSFQSSVPLQVISSSKTSSFQWINSRFQNAATLVVKVTHRCNLDCLYCYENITKGNDMSIQTFRSLVDQVFTSTTKSKVTFLFHGGEPSLMDESWFLEAVSYARTKAREFGKRAVFSMQSNILALNDRKISLFRELGINLSVSIDGPPTLPNAMRKRAEVALKTYERLRANSLHPGILMTINQSNFNHFTEICHWLENSLQIRDFKANVVTSVGAGVNLPDMRAEQIFQAYHDMLEYMIETKGEGVIEDNLVLELVRFFATEEERGKFPHELCRSQRCGAGDRVLGITPDGKLLPCGRFQWDDEGYFLGDLFDKEDEEVLGAFTQAINQFHMLVPENWYDCSDCAAKDVCSYGCQAFIVRSKSQANVDCIPTKMRYRYYLENRERLMPVIEVIRNRIAQSSRYSTNYRDVYSDSGQYNDQYSDDKGSYADVYSDVSYGDNVYSDVRGYEDYSDKYSDG